jgi:16S rRNA (guanine527-N7)-methyltransferase
VFHVKPVVERFGAPASAVEPLERLLRLQRDDPTASTTVREPALALERHVADSLVALALEPVRSARVVGDLGAGAGWPGLALAATLPEAHVSLVESQIRHCRYLVKAVEVAGLTNAEVINARAEEWSGGFVSNDLITARALAALPVVLEYAAPLLSVGGHVVAWKGAVGAEEAADGAYAAQELGLEPVEVLHVEPFAGARDHTLHVFRKIAPTPDRFPRRPGMAIKRPLRA